MKVPNLRILPVAVVSLAMLTGTSAVAAGAANAAATDSAHTATAAPARAAGHLKAPVTGTFHNHAGRGHFTGRFIPRKFTVHHGVLKATGLLKGRLTSANGKRLGTVHRTVTMPVNTPRAHVANAAACSVLNLRLGPLNLNLLGLAVHLNRVHLTITAVPGAGNLLGNLLCQVASLLNGPGNLGQVASLLNRVLALL
jgi:hypothetical protein